MKVGSKCFHFQLVKISGSVFPVSSLTAKTPQILSVFSLHFPPPFRLRARPSYQHTATNANATGYRLLRGRLQLSLCGRFATPRQLGPNLRTWCHLESDSCTSPPSNCFPNITGYLPFETVALFFGCWSFLYRDGGREAGKIGRGQDIFDVLQVLSI